MGKNKGDKKKPGLKENFKSGGGKELEGLKADVQQQALDALNDSERKYEPYEKIKGKLVDEEVERRAQLLEKALFTEYPSIKDQIKNTKPDLNPIYNEEGEVVRPAGYSKEKHDEKSKLIDRFEKLKEAIEQARSQGNFNYLDDYATNYNL